MDFKQVYSILSEGKDNFPKRDPNDFKKGLFVDTMDDDPNQFGVFGESGHCYLKANQQKAESYLESKYNAKQIGDARRDMRLAFVDGKLKKEDVIKKHGKDLIDNLLISEYGSKEAAYKVKGK